MPEPYTCNPQPCKGIEGVPPLAPQLLERRRPHAERVCELREQRCRTSSAAEASDKAQQDLEGLRTASVDLRASLLSRTQALLSCATALQVRRMWGLW